MPQHDVPAPSGQRELQGRGDGGARIDGAAGSDASSQQRCGIIRAGTSSAEQPPAMRKAVRVGQDPQPGNDRASDRADRPGGGGGYQCDRQNGTIAPQSVACEQAAKEARDHSSVRHEDCVCRRSAARECQNCNLAQQRCGTDECIHHTRCTALEEPSHQRFSIGRAERTVLGSNGCPRLVRSVENKSNMFAQRDQVSFRHRGHLRRDHPLDLEHPERLSGTGRAERCSQHALPIQGAAIAGTQVAEHVAAPDDPVVQEFFRTEA